MKILYLSEMLGPHDYRFLTMLISRGYAVTLVTYRKGMDEAGLEGALYDVRRIKGLKIIHNAALAENTPLNFLRRRNDLRAIINYEKPDVLHAGWVQTSGFLAALSGFHPYLLMPWGSDIIFYSKNCLRNRVASRYAISRADMITTDCEYEKRILVEDFKYPAPRVVVMPWDVDLRFFHKENRDPGLKKKLGLEGKKILLMMRIFRPEYGIVDFIRALPRVKAEHPEARALILGYGPLEKGLKETASSLGLDDFIHWTGYVPQSEVVKYINISDVYVSTSLRDGSSSSLLESMACGLPAVVTDIPGNTEWIEDGENGFVVKRGDTDSIAGGINRMLEDEAARLVMSARNAEKAGKNADFAKNFSKLEDMYRTLAGQAR